MTVDFISYTRNGSFRRPFASIKIFGSKWSPTLYGLVDSGADCLAIDQPTANSIGLIGTASSSTTATGSSVSGSIATGVSIELQGIPATTDCEIGPVLPAGLHPSNAASAPTPVIGREALEAAMPWYMFDRDGWSYKNK